MADDEYDFCKALMECQTISNHQLKKREFFRDYGKTLGLDKVESLISIGAGHGDLDSFIITECMPRLKEYYGEEPHEETRKLLEKTMSGPKFACFRVKTYPDLAQDWSGPGVKVDLVLIVQCLQFIKGQQAFLSKCFNEWLKPGGQLIAVVPRVTNFSRIAAQTFAPESPITYHADLTREELKAIGVSDVSEYTFGMECWPKDGDRDFMASILNRHPKNDEEVEAFYELRRKLSPGNIVHNNIVFQCSKPKTPQ